MSREAAAAEAMAFHMELIITWFCSRFSEEEALRMNISPALLNLP